MKTVPEQWIPFIPVHIPNSTRETQLRRAALLRILEREAVSDRNHEQRCCALDCRTRTISMRKKCPARARSSHNPTNGLAGWVGKSSHGSARESRRDEEKAPAVWPSTVLSMHRRGKLEASETPLGCLADLRFASVSRGCPVLTNGRGLGSPPLPFAPSIA
jgi:hypothetical protein